MTSAISGAFPTEVLPGPSRRTVEAEGASSAPGRVRRGFSDLLKGIGIADVPTNPLLLHDEGKEIARPLCIPPTWDEKRITKACACLTLSTAACATTTVMRTTTVPAVPTLGVGVGGLIGRGEAYRVKSAITEVVAGTVTNTITATSVSTVTKVKTVQAQATSIAGNGLSYKRYTHAFSGYVRDNGFTASFFKRRTPEGVGALGSLSWSTQNWPASPPRPGLLTLSSAPAVLNHTKAAAGAPFDAEQAAVVAQGFFVARAGAGTYVFEVPAELADNWAYLWLGEDAYCDWTDRNAVLSASRVADTISADGRFALDLADGEAVPFTYIWANGGGAGRSALRVRLPNGGVGVGVIGEGGADIAPYFVQACDAEVFAAKTFT